MRISTVFLLIGDKSDYFLLSWSNSSILSYYGIEISLRKGFFGELGSVETVIKLENDGVIVRLAFDGVIVKLSWNGSDSVMLEA